MKALNLCFSNLTGMSNLTDFDGKYRVVLERCGALNSSTDVDSEGFVRPSSDPIDCIRGCGVLITIEDIKADILRHMKGAAFDSLEEAQVLAFDLISADPEGRYQIVKGLIFVEYVNDRQYWEDKAERVRNRHAMIGLLIAVIISSAILFWKTPLQWASYSLLLSVVVAVIFRRSDLTMSVFLPAIIAVLSSLLYSFVY